MKHPKPQRMYNIHDLEKGFLKNQTQKVNKTEINQPEIFYEDSSENRSRHDVIIENNLRLVCLMCYGIIFIIFGCIYEDKKYNWVSTTLVVLGIGTIVFGLIWRYILHHE